MAKYIQLRRDTTANWLAVNPVLRNGELGVEITTTAKRKVKMGDGTARWDVLPYLINMADIEEELQSYIDDLEGVKTDIADEKTTREQGDTALTQELADEKTTREQGDTALTQELATEKTARQQGDELLETLTQFVKNQLLEELDYFNERLDPWIPDDIGSENDCLIMAENGKVLTEEVRQTWR